MYLFELLPRDSNRPCLLSCSISCALVCQPLSFICKQMCSDHLQTGRIIIGPIMARKEWPNNTQQIAITRLPSAQPCNDNSSTPITHPKKGNKQCIEEYTLSRWYETNPLQNSRCCQQNFHKISHASLFLFFQGIPTLQAPDFAHVH